MIANLFAPGAIEVAESSPSFAAAIADSAGLLVRAGHATSGYVTEVLENLANLGPYFVVAPSIAIAHAKPSAAVLSAGLALLKLEQGVESGNNENDPVRLVFSLCTPSADEHIDLLAQFARVMSAPDVVNRLLNASAESVIRDILGN